MGEVLIGEGVDGLRERSRRQSRHRRCGRICDGDLVAWATFAQETKKS